MYLRSLCIENFRSICRAQLDFDATTFLIGENDCGKSSLFEAIAKALSPDDAAPQFQAHHFFRDKGDATATPLGEIRIELTFEERRAGEWDQIESGVLAPLLATTTAQPRQLVLRLLGPLPDDSPVAEGRWRIFSPGGEVNADDLPALNALRALNRFVWLRGGSLLGPEASGVRLAPSSASINEDIAPLAQEIEARYEALRSGTSRHEQSELKTGYQAALELLSQRAVQFHSAGALSGSLVEEILDQRGLDAGQRAQAFHGSVAQQIGVLILTAAILRHLPGTPVAGAESILVLEDPEAHLHLMTLASVWGLLDHIPAQKIISTQSGRLLAAAPLHGVRRLTRQEGVLRQWRVCKGRLSAEELRKLSYHLRVRRADASFARCWLLVEGETEFWVLPELARLCGYDLTLEGVAVVEFAQCGLAPLIKMATELGIEWHLLADGDKAGRDYVETARELLHDKPLRRRITALRQRDIEHCFWKHGYASVFQRAAGERTTHSRRVQPTSVINRAVKRYSKPHMAFELIVAAAAEDSPGVPAPLKRMLDTCVQLARAG